MERPFFPTETSANLGKDWPDSRGIWINEDKSLYAYINRKDHILISLVENNSNLKNSFAKFANFVKEVIEFLVYFYFCKFFHYIF